MPPSVALLLIFFMGLVLGAIVNWATYSLAWNRRCISPWSVPAREIPPRKITDRIPVIGWIGLRRESSFHGPGFWLRPMAVELAMGIGLAALYRWEVLEMGLIGEQVAGIWRHPVSNDSWKVPEGWLLGEFMGHTILILFMAAATLIDMDEKIIPDEITVPGTLIGLLLAPFLPMTLLPHLGLSQSMIPGAHVVKLQKAEIGLQEGWQLILQPVGLVSPNAWPQGLQGAPNIWSLILGLACFGLWCFALTPRYWRGRGGFCRGLVVIGRRIAREMARPPLAWIAFSGTTYVAICWWLGGELWQGLLSSLVGLVITGSVVWAVRLVGTAALRREAMGFGDVTLMMMIGTYVGWQAGLIIFFVSPFAGLVVGCIQLLFRRGDVIPYGPFLCLGTLFVIVKWGSLWSYESIQSIFSLGWLVLLVMGFGMFLLGFMLVAWRMTKMALFRN